MTFHSTSLLLREHVKTDGVQREYRRWKSEGDLLCIRTEIMEMQALQRDMKFPIHDLC